MIIKSLLKFLPPRRISVVFFFFTILVFTTISTPAQETLEQWKAKTIEKYPDLAVPDSLFNKQFLAEYRKQQESNPKLLENPQWPMIIAQTIEKQLLAKIPGIDIPTENASTNHTPPIKLITGEDIKRKWLQDMPQARKLAANYHSIQKANAAKQKAIENGSYDDQANKEATKINIARLTAAGYTKEAADLQRMLLAQRAREAQESATVQQYNQRVLDQMRLDDMKRAIEQQNRELRNVSRQLGN